MMDDATPGAGSNILAPGALQYVFDRELQRALRARTVLTLLTVSIELTPTTTAPDESTIGQVGKLVEQVMREQDVLGYLEVGLLGLILLNSGYERAACVADRLVASFEQSRLPAAVTFTIGAASYPTHAMGAASLKRWALSHPIATCRSDLRSSVQQK